MKALQSLNIEGFISKKRQILSTLLIAVSTSVSADFSYTVNGDTVTITGYYNASPLPELISVIPSVIEGKPVTSIGDSVFRNCFGLIDIYFCGNAPEKGSTIFLEASPVTVYYKTNTAGWLATFGGMPTAAWDPQIQTGNTDFGVRSNRFGFTVTGSTNFAGRIEACTNLSHGIWTPVGTAALNSGTLSFIDPASPITPTAITASPCRSNNFLAPSHQV